MGGATSTGHRNSCSVFSAGVAQPRGLAGAADELGRDLVELVTEADLGELLPLMRDYYDFYEVDPPDEALLAMSRELIADPEREGLQLVARDDTARAVGFAHDLLDLVDAQRVTLEIGRLSR
jgi:hypothetical protein